MTADPATYRCFAQRTHGDVVGERHGRGPATPLKGDAVSLNDPDPETDGADVELNETQSGSRPSVSGRASEVILVLQQCWGDELPPSPDPVHTVMTDAVAIDDEQGRAAGLVVQSDAVSLDLLHQLLRSTGSMQERMLLLPPALAERLISRYVAIDLHQLCTMNSTDDEHDPS